ncbi:MAG TPA: T9SS type A sorting domain-containing protein [Flavobacteriales bacterium]|nr:T9SS type A sorting domain-containing protein [Flavobacteriales bacterium]MCB0787332.1 T9SS type A sorting domain-containing protein [Flavobacteriales bacterium]MCB0814495.1 T9SS type A sorting domain-containing protein [Flavobacteriales bacterium]HOP44802.1 T9SS type A sorting domain-containing protein [Flavobacteriales bacterium]
MKTSETLQLTGIGLLAALGLSLITIGACAQAVIPPDQYEIDPVIEHPSLAVESGGTWSGAISARPEAPVEMMSLPPYDERMYDIEFLGKINKPLTEVDSIKAILNAATEGTDEEGRTEHGPIGEEKATNPSVGYSFDANTQSSSTPMDNSIAMNEQDVIVTVNNGGVFMYDRTGQQLSAATWQAFAGRDCFDPHVLFDAESNRFIIVALSGNSSSTSRLMVWFSASQNPLLSWYPSSITASSNTNILGSGNWMDFPALGLSDKEVFITVNVFNNSNDFQKSVIFQIPHASGYAGNGIGGTGWSVSNSPFTGYHVTPAPSGWSGRFSKGQYFVVSRSYGDDRIRLLKITDHLSGSPQLTQQVLNVSSYALPSDAPQSGTSKRLDVGSCAVQNAFHLSGMVHCVLTTRNSSSVSKIRYIRIQTGNSPSTQSLTFNSSANTYLAYPSVVAYSNSAQGGANKNVIVGYLASNTSGQYPSMRAVNCDHSGTWSNSSTVKSGQSYISYNSSSVQRWGDYIGMFREYTTGPEPRVWMAGAYATSNHVYRGRIAELGAMGPIMSVDESIEGAPFAGPSLYPNPAIDRVQFEFDQLQAIPTTVAVMDASGRVVKTIYSGIPRLGRERITFWVDDLPAGLYVVGAISEGGFQHRLRFLVQH